MTTIADAQAEITEFMLTSLAEAGFEDTTANRRDFLAGLAEAWAEEPDEEGKSTYTLALSLMRIPLVVGFAHSQYAARRDDISSLR